MFVGPIGKQPAPGIFILLRSSPSSFFFVSYLLVKKGIFLCIDLVTH